MDKSFIKRRLGMTAWEIEAELKEASDMAAMGTNMSELQPGSFGAFEFNEDQSAKTTRTSKNQHTYKFDKESKFTAGTNADISWSGLEQGDDDGTGDTYMDDILFGFPEEGIGKGRKHGEMIVVEDTSLEDSDFSPSILVYSFNNNTTNTHEGRVPIPLGYHRTSDGRLAPTKDPKTGQDEKIITQQTTQNTASDISQPAVKFFCGSPDKLETASQQMIALKIQLAEIEADMKRHKEDVVLQDSKNNADGISTIHTGINNPSSGHMLPEARSSHERPSNNKEGETHDSGVTYDVTSPAG